MRCNFYLFLFLLITLERSFFNFYFFSFSFEYFFWLFLIHFCLFKSILVFNYLLVSSLVHVDRYKK